MSREVLKAVHGLSQMAVRIMQSLFPARLSGFSSELDDM
jgi:hypothetical protein